MIVAEHNKLRDWFWLDLPRRADLRANIRYYLRQRVSIRLATSWQLVVLLFLRDRVYEECEL